MINQNQEAEASLEDIQAKLNKSIARRQAEVDKNRQNIEHSSNHEYAL